MDIADDVTARLADPATAALVAQMDSSSTTTTLWGGLALAGVKQAFQDATVGDYTALCWLVTEGRDWLIALGLSPWAADHWGAGDFVD